MPVRIAFAALRRRPFSQMEADEDAAWGGCDDECASAAGRCCDVDRVAESVDVAGVDPLDDAEKVKHVKNRRKC